MRTTQQANNLGVACGFALIIYGSLSASVSVIRLFQIGASDSTINFRVFSSSAGEALIAIFSGFLLVLRPEKIVVGVSAWCCALIVKDFFLIPRNVNWSYWSKDLNIVCHVLWYLAVPLSCMVGVVALQRRRVRTSYSNSQPSCVQCSYLLRGLTEPRCPECGRMYTLDEFYQL